MIEHYCICRSNVIGRIYLCAVAKQMPRVAEPNNLLDSPQVVCFYRKTMEHGRTTVDAQKAAGHAIGPGTTFNRPDFNRPDFDRPDIARRQINNSPARADYLPTD